MTLLAFLRHAETPWSQDGRIQAAATRPSKHRRATGCGSVPAGTLRGSVVLSSPLLRCRQTADARTGAASG